MRVHRFSRRMWLRGAAGLAVAVPFLPSLFERAYGANLPPTGRRFICMYSPMGMGGGFFWPTATPGPSADPRYRELRLTDLPGPVSEVIADDFTPLKDKLLVIRGLDGLIADQGHGSAPMALTGYGESTVGSTHASIDQLFAASSKVYPGAAPAVRSLVLSPRIGQRAADGLTYISFQRGTGRVTPRYDLNRLLSQLFVTVPQPQVNLKRFVVDNVLTDYQQAMKSRHLSAVDKQRLEGHVEGLVDLQRRAGATTTAMCAPPPPTGLPTNDGALEQAAQSDLGTYFDPVIDAYIDLIVAAVKCGLTNVATLAMGQPGTAGEPRAYTNLTTVPGISTNSHHGFSHELTSPTHAAAPQLKAIQRMFGSKVAQLLTKLNVPEEATGATYLDSSIVLWTNEMGDGYDHRSYGMPVLVGGSGGGALRTNLLMDYQNRTFNRSVRMFEGSFSYPELMGLPYHRLLITLLQAMGLTPADYEETPGAGFGEVSGSEHLAQSDLYELSGTARAAPLPNLLTSP